MTPTGDSDHGAQLVFRADPMGPPALIQLPGIGVGVECPGFLHAKGPVTVGDRTVPEVEIWYALDVARMRYKVARLCLAVDYSEDEIDAELLRSIRWAQMAAPGLDTFGRIVVVGPGRSRGAPPQPDHAYDRPADRGRVAEGPHRRGGPQQANR